MQNFSPSKMFEKRRYQGIWWIPGSDTKCYGTLFFDIDGEQKLCLIGNIEEENPLSFVVNSRFRTIHGECWINRKLTCVTVFDAVCINLTTNLLDTKALPESTLSFSELWIGNVHYNTREDISFSVVYFGLNNLEKWKNDKGVFVSTIEEHLKSVSTDMKTPESIVLFSDEKVTISIDYIKQFPQLSIGQTEYTISCTPSIRISAKNGSLPYYGNEGTFEYYSLFMYHLFSLFLFGQTFFFCMHGYQSAPQGDLSIQPIQEELLYARDITAKQRKSIHLLQDVLFPYCVIKDCLEVFIVSFHREYKRMRIVLETLLSSIQSSSYTTESLPRLLYSLEGLQQLFYHSLGEGRSPENIENYTLFNETKNKIVQLCDTEDLKRFVRENIHWKKTFRDRLFYILMDNRNIFDFLNDSISGRLSDDFKKIRNDAAHSNERDSSFIDYTLLLHQVFFVHFLHIAIIMKTFGVSPEEIKSRLKTTFRCYFDATMEYLRNHYETI